VLDLSEEMTERRVPHPREKTQNMIVVMELIMAALLFWQSVGFLAVRRLKMGKTIILVIAWSSVGLVLTHMAAQDRGKPKRVNLRELRNKIEKQLPTGSTKKEVTDFLDARRIKHGDIVLTKYDSQYSDNGVEKRLLYASIPRIRKVLLIEWGIYMSFRFDADDRLIEYRIRKVGTGP
jgi:hypothetical protein